MDFDESLVVFKSLPEIWHKEKSGKKPNTVRTIAQTDTRLRLLKEGKAKTIRIINTQTSAFFDRQIEDVTFFNELVIISWKHQLGDEGV